MSAQTVALILIAIIVAIGSSLGILPDDNSPDPGFSSLPPASSQADTMVLGYYMQDRRNAAWPTLQNNTDVLTAVAPWGWGLTTEGRLRPVYFDEQHLGDVLRLAGQRNVETHVLIHNFNPDSGAFDAAIANAVLADATVRETAIANIVRAARDWGITGVHIDFEGVDAARRHDLTAFMAQLRQELEPFRIQLSIAVPAATHATADSTWTRAYDYEALARHVDFIMVMAYDQHWSGGPPGPVAAMPWVRSVVEYTLDPAGGNVPPSQVVLGIPAYGYDWPKDGSRSADAVTFAEISRRFNAAHSRNPAIAVQWHADYLTPFLRYEGREAWFENASSIAHKLQLAYEYGLRGVALWRLGQEDPDMWKTLRSAR